MANLGRLWAGKLFGTNTGNLSADFETTDNKVSGTIRFMDDKFGIVIYKVQGTFDGSEVVLSGDAVQAPEGVNTGKVAAKAALNAEGQLRGTWESELGTGGTLHLFPHDPPVSPVAKLPGAPPEQLHTATRVVGALRLYGEDVRELIAFITRDFNQTRVIVTYNERGNEISKYSTDFLADFARIGELRRLKLQIQEHEAYGINRQVMVDLDNDVKNEVRVQGVQESWVVGKAEAIASHLRRRQKSLATTFRRFGLNINGLIALMTLVLLPELTVARRIIFIIIVAGVLWTLTKVHQRFIPNLIIRSTSEQPGVMAQLGPQTISWLLAVSAGLASAIAYGLLKGELPAFSAWLSGLSQ